MIKIIFQIAIPLLLALTGLMQTAFYLHARKRISSWPTVAAEITLSRLLNHLDLNNNNILEALIYFKYKFRGIEYEVNTPVLRGHDMFPSYKHENGLTKKYKIGDIVNAKVHPEFHDVCYLEIAPLSRLSTILAPIFFIGGVSLIAGYFYGMWEFFYDTFFWRVDLFFNG